MNRVILEKVFNRFFAKNGPDFDDFQTLADIAEILLPQQINDLRMVIMPILNHSTLIGLTFSKPFGYSGDFFIMEKIYQKYISQDEKSRKWDMYFHSMHAVDAISNRKDLAKKILSAQNNRLDASGKSVLILGSGPATEVHEYLSQTPENKLSFDLVDIDQRAIDYARNKNKAFLQNMRFLNENVIRYSPEKKYDLIWSAGLFDYFKDKHFVYLLKKYYEYITPGGEMIIGNFNRQNISRRCMEVYGDWYLYHRSEEELAAFAQQAGIPPSKIKIMKEPLGINLFLSVKK